MLVNRSFFGLIFPKCLFSSFVGNRKFWLFRLSFLFVADCLPKHINFVLAYALVLIPIGEIPSKSRSPKHFIGWLAIFTINPRKKFIFFKVRIFNPANAFNKTNNAFVPLCRRCGSFCFLADISNINAVIFSKIIQNGLQLIIAFFSFCFLFFRAFYIQKGIGANNNLLDRIFCFFNTCSYIATVLQFAWVNPDFYASSASGPFRARLQIGMEERRNRSYA